VVGENPIFSERIDVAKLAGIARKGKINDCGEYGWMGWAPCMTFRGAMVGIRNSRCASFSAFPRRLRVTENGYLSHIY
jgi:hypothetical protein